MYKRILRPLLFLIDPEKVHHFTFRLIKLTAALGILPLISRYYRLEDRRLERKVLGLTFKNPVGLAAGFDKDAKLYNELAALGFGFVEIGTLTPRPQQGNPPQRLFRLREDEALINRMGFNNEGIDAAARRLVKERRTLVGGNIGKNKDTPNEMAVQDYLLGMNVLYDRVDYFAVNVSSPNTPGLRELQDKEPLRHLLLTLKEENKNLSNPGKGLEKPILLKISPDLTYEQLSDIIEIVESTGIAGVIATNTTLERTGLQSDRELQEQQGGLSGKPLSRRSTEVIRYLAENRNQKFAIIGVGGIHSAGDALEKLEAGADLVQLWTGFVYEGPRLIRDIKEKLLNEGVES